MNNAKRGSEPTEGSQIIALAFAEGRRNPWGSLLRFPSLERILPTFGATLIANAERLTERVSLSVTLAPDGIPETMARIVRSGTMDETVSRESDIVAALFTSAARSWTLMTGKRPSSMGCSLVVTTASGTSRNPHFDSDEGSVVVTMAGIPTMLLNPDTGRHVTAEAFRPICIPGSGQGKIGILHWVTSDPRRAVAIFRCTMSGTKKPRPSKLRMNQTFDRTQVRLLTAV